MNREVHVRFWEGLAVRFRWATQLSLLMEAHPLWLTSNFSGPQTYSSSRSGRISRAPWMMR